MTTGYVALYTIGGDGLGIASAATDVSLANRNLALGTGSVTGFSGTFGSAGTGLALVVGGGGTVYTKANIGGNLSTSTTNAYGLVVQPTMTWGGAATPAATGLVVAPIYSGTFTTVYGAYLNASSGGTIDTAYSLYVDNPSSGTTKVCGYFGGNVGIGKTVPTELLHLESSLRTTVIGIQTTGEANLMRLFKAGAGSRGDWTLNLDNDGVNWQRDDISATGLGVALRNDGIIGFRGTAAGANPATLTEAFQFDAINGRMAIGDSAPSTNWRLLVSGRIHVGDDFDGTAYGQIQITRPAAQGTGFHQTFIRSGNAVVGMGFLSSSNTFGIHHGLDNTGSVGIFVNNTGSVGIGLRAPTYPLDVSYTNSAGGIAETGLRVANTITTNSTQITVVSARSWSFVANGSLGGSGLSIQDNTAGAARLTFGTTGLATFGIGIALPTTGGTAATLDHYEELSTTLTFSGIWASSQAVTCRFVRVGKQVTLMVPGVFAACTVSASVSTSGIPSRFYPVTSTYYIARVTNGGASTTGMMIVISVGGLTISANLSSGSFTSGGLTAGWDAFSLTWNIL